MNYKLLEGCAVKNQQDFFKDWGERNEKNSDKSMHQFLLLKPHSCHDLQVLQGD